jgi:hypothetical protein
VAWLNVHGYRPEYNFGHARHRCTRTLPGRYAPRRPHTDGSTRCDDDDERQPDRGQELNVPPPSHRRGMCSSRCAVLRRSGGSTAGTQEPSEPSSNTTGTPSTVSVSPPGSRRRSHVRAPSTSSSRRWRPTITMSSSTWVGRSARTTMRSAMLDHQARDCRWRGGHSTAWLGKGPAFPASCDGTETPRHGHYSVAGDRLAACLQRR